MTRAGALHARASDRLVTLFTAMARRALVGGSTRAAMSWASTAAEFAWGVNPGYYASRDLEEVLLACGARLPDSGAAAVPAGHPRGPLHILTRAYDIGGHARLIERWITRAAAGSHSLVVLDQPADELPDWLVRAVGATGGSVTSLCSHPFEERAARLRALWHARAEYAVDHCHPHDPVPCVAFSQEGGPPVVKFDAADHVFWLGISVADAVLELRESGRQCSLSRRGARAAHVVGIPLARGTTRTRSTTLRRELGVDDDACVLLTVAAGYKYTPMGEWDFPALMGAALRAEPSACLLAVGPLAEAGWQRLTRTFPGRAFALGEQRDLVPMLAAADVYVDSLPFCSITSSLEASQAGLPVHRYANRHAPLMSNDDPAFAGGTAAADPSSYLEALGRMVRDPAWRAATASRQAAGVEDWHSSSRWDRRLHEVLANLHAHRVDLTSAPGDRSIAEETLAAFQYEVGFLARFGIGVQSLKANRAALPSASRWRGAAAMLGAFPGYFRRPKVAAQAAREFLRPASG